MSFTPPLIKPNAVDYTVFIRSVMGISTAVLPDDSAAITFSLAVALELVSLDLQTISPTMYALAVYNLAGDRLLNYAQDLPDAPDIQGSNPPAPFFAAARSSYKINSFVAGVVKSAEDESTGESLQINEIQQLSLMDLQNLKTPFGRTYLQIAQTTGPTAYGLS